MAISSLPVYFNYTAADVTASASSQPIVVTVTVSVVVVAVVVIVIVAVVANSVRLLLCQNTVIGYRLPVMESLRKLRRTRTAT